MSVLAEVEPAARWTPRPFRVTRRRRETADSWTVELDGGEPLAFVPGQFTMLSAGGHGEVPISISGDPATPERLVHTVRDVGLATHAVCSARPGDVLGVRGPYGRGWPLDAARGGDVVVVAGGLGLAPVRPALYALLADRASFGRVVLLYGSRDPQSLLYASELSGWSGAADIDVAVTVDAGPRSWRGSVGVVPRLIERARFDPARTTAFVVGPEIMMRFSIAALRERGVADGRIHVSLERNMQCGFGHCGHCQLGPLIVCRDGPVFSAAVVGALMGVREL